MRDAQSNVGLKSLSESGVTRLEAKMSKALERKSVELLTSDIEDGGEASLATSGVLELQKLHESTKGLLLLGARCPLLMGQSVVVRR